MARIGYKLTTAQNTTHNDTQWGEGVTHTANGQGGLCGPGWIHFYDDANLAVLLNPIHGNFRDPNLWVVEWIGKTLNDKGMKRGATSVTTIRQIPLPIYTREQKVAFGILCARYVSKDKVWRRWAENWLSGRNRSRNAAYAAYDAAAAYAAAADAAYTAANAAANATANAAYTAAYTAANPLPLKSLAKKALAYT